MTGNPEQQQRPIVLLILISNLEMGGAERQVVQIANGLDKAVFRVNVVSLGASNPLSGDLDSDIHFESLADRHNSLLGKAAGLYALLRRIRPDVLHAFLFDADMLARFVGRAARVPRIIGSERNSDYPVGGAKRIIKRLTSGLLDLCVANSEAGAAYNRKLYGMPKERYRVVRNGVDIERFRPRNLDDRVALRIANDIPPLAKVVGMFASMKEQKNHLTLIRAAEIAEQSTPGIIYLLIGGELELGQRQTSAYAAELGELVLRSPIRNQFRVLGKRSDVEDLYPCCDLTVLPSWHEGFPNVLLESMACGVGFVASDVADNRWIAETYQAGAIVPPGDAESLARQIVQGLDAHGPFSTSGCLERVRSDIARSNMVAKQQAIYRETA